LWLNLTTGHTVKGAVMLDKNLIERIKRPIEPDKCIAPGTVPILYTGNYAGAKACTISLNPFEFYAKKGEVHPIARKEAFGKEDNEPLSDKDAEAVLKFCDTYFDNKQVSFFNQLEEIIGGFGSYSYNKGTCVHLDLVQWETTPLWGKLSQNIRDYHLNNDGEILSGLLKKDFEFIFLNGNKVVKTVSKRFNLDLEPSVLQLTQKRKIYFGFWNKTKIIGWSPFFGKWPMGNDDFKKFLDSLKEKYTEWNKR
jgi:hypothetical protein